MTTNARFQPISGWAVVRRLCCPGLLVAALAGAGIALPQESAAQAAAGAVATPARNNQAFLRPARSLPLGRAFHGTAVLGDYLYVIGGASASTPGQEKEGELSTLCARIQENGDLGPWVPTTPIPKPRHYLANATVVLNDYVYVMGGADRIESGGRSENAIFTTARPDGQLMPWRESKPFPETGLSFVAAVSTPGFIHVTGGVTTQRTLTNKVWSVRVMPDGSLGNWEQAPSLPVPIWFHQAAAVSGRVFVWGGLLDSSSANPNPSKRVFCAPVLGSGRLGKWQEIAPLPTAFYSASSTTAGSYLFSFFPRYAGQKTGTLSNDVWWTQVTPSGLKEWKPVKTQVPIRVYHAVAADYRRGAIYMPGGKPSREDDIGAVAAYFKLSGRVQAEAERAWIESERANQNSVSTATLSEQEKAPGGAAAAGAETASATSPIPGFTPLTSTNLVAPGGGTRPLVIYFTANKAKPCIEQNAKLQALDTKSLGARAALTYVDIEKYPQMAQQYGVFRVPSWIVYHSTGAESGRATGVLEAAELAARIGALQ